MVAEIPLWEASRALVLQRQPEKAWPRAWPTSGTSWKASVDTRSQWKQEGEGRRRSCNGRSWKSEERKRQVHRWVPVRALPGQKRRWEEVMCQDLPPGQPASYSRAPCCLHLTPHRRVRGVSGFGTYEQKWWWVNYPAGLPLVYLAILMYSCTWKFSS